MGEIGVVAVVKGERLPNKTGGGGEWVRKNAL